MEEVREYERTMQEKTNDKVKSSQSAGEAADDQKKPNTCVNYTYNPENSYYYVCPHPHFKIRHPSLQVHSVRNRLDLQNYAWI